MKTLFTTALVLGLLAMGSAKPLFANEAGMSSADSEASILSLDQEEADSLLDGEEEALSDDFAPGNWICFKKCQLKFRACAHRCREYSHSPIKERLCLNHCRVQLKRCEFSCRFD